MVNFQIWWNYATPGSQNSQQIVNFTFNFQYRDPKVPGSNPGWQVIFTGCQLLLTCCEYNLII